MPYTLNHTNMTIGQNAADTVLQTPKTIRIGKKKIKVKPICPATFVAASGIVSSFPQSTKIVEETDLNLLIFAMLDAHKYDGIGKAIAILALGQTKGHCDSWWKRRRRQRLADYIDSYVSATELKSILHQLLEGLDLKAFFQLTTSLSELNLLRTKSDTQFGV